MLYLDLFFTFYRNLYLHCLTISLNSDDCFTGFLSGNHTLGGYCSDLFVRGFISNLCLRLYSCLDRYFFTDLNGQSPP